AGAVNRAALVPPAVPGSTGEPEAPRELLEGESMRLLKSIVRPDKVDQVKNALSALHVSGLTVTEVRGHGKQKGHTAVYRGQEYDVSLLPKMEIEVVVADEIADEAIQGIIQSART